MNSDLLQAMNNSDTLRLLASIELACYRCKQALMDPRLHFKARRLVERIIKDDRRKRHRRRKDQDAMIDAFARQTLTNELPIQPMLSSAQNEGVVAPLVETMNSLVVSEEQIAHPALTTWAQRWESITEIDVVCVPVWDRIPALFVLFFLPVLYRLSVHCLV